MKRPRSRGFFVLLLVAASLLPSLSSAQVNLLTNPGFEDSGGSFNGWTTFGSGRAVSLPSSDNIIRTGAAAAKAYGEFVGCPPGTFSVGGFYQSFTPTVGKVYTFSGFALVSSGDPMLGTNTCASNRMIAKIAFFNLPVGGSTISVNEMIIGDGHSPTNQWNAFSLSALAPTGAQRVQAMFMFLQPACDPGAVFVDDTDFRELDPPAPKPNLLANPSFDTNLTGWTPFENVLHETRSFALRTPPGSIKLYGPFSTPGAASGLFQSFAAAPGSVWRLDAYSMHTCEGNPAERTTGDNLGIARIVFRDGSNNEIGSDQVVIIDKNSPLATWTEHGVIATAQAGTVTVGAYILYVQPVVNEGGSMLVDDVNFRQLTATDFSVSPSAPRFALHQNVPNPFNPATRIAFDLGEEDAVDVSVYDVAGRWITTLVHGELDSGPHFTTWNGKAANGAAVAAGIYRYVLTTSRGRVSRNMVLLQ